MSNRRNPPGRTLLGLQQQHQYVRPAPARPPPVTASAAPSLPAVTNTSNHADLPPAENDAALPSQTAERDPNPDAATIASEATTAGPTAPSLRTPDSTISTGEVTLKDLSGPAAMPPAAENRTSDTSLLPEQPETGKSSINPQRPSLINYGSDRKPSSLPGQTTTTTPTAAAEAADGPTESIEQLKPADAGSTLPAPVSVTPLNSQNLMKQDGAMSSTSHSETSEARSRNRPRGTSSSVASNGSNSSHTSRNRRGYWGSQGEGSNHPNEPRDLLASVERDSSTSTSRDLTRNPQNLGDEDHEPSPLSFLDQVNTVQNMSPTSRRKRGHLLSQKSGLTRRSLLGTQSVDSLNSASTHSDAVTSLDAVAEADALSTAHDDAFDDAVSSAPDHAGISNLVADADVEHTSHHTASHNHEHPRYSPSQDELDVLSQSVATTASGDSSSGKAGGSVGPASEAIDVSSRRDTPPPSSSSLWGPEIESEELHSRLPTPLAPNFSPLFSRSEVRSSPSESGSTKIVKSTLDSDPYFEESLIEDRRVGDAGTSPEEPSRRKPSGSGRRGQAYATGVTLEAPPLPARRKLSAPQDMSELKSPEQEPAQTVDAARSGRRGLQRTKREQWESHILRADWEELEVARFLNTFGKHVHEVRSRAPLDPTNFTQTHFPLKGDWTKYSKEDGNDHFDAAGYYLAYITAFLSYLSPNTMVDLQRDNGLPATGDNEQDSGDEHDEEEAAESQKFRLGALRANGERLYFSALPLWEQLGGRLRKIWRWESKITSLLSAVLYTFLWWRGLLFASLIFSIIMLVLTLKTSPPQPDTLREILARQRRREEEGIRLQAKSRVTLSPLAAAQMTIESRNSKYSLLAEASRNYGVQASMLAGALADGHERAKNFALWRSPRATWRLLLWLSIIFFASLAVKPVYLIRLPGAGAGLMFFLLAPIMEHKPHWLGVEWSNPFDFIFAGVPNDAQYSMEVLRNRARLGKPLVTDPALLLRPDMTEEAAISQNSGGGSEGSGGRVDWTRWADLVLHGKTMAIRGTEVLAGSRSVTLPRLPVNQVESGSGTGSVLLSHMSRGINFGIQALENKSKKTAQGTSTAVLRDIGNSEKENGIQITSNQEDIADVDGTFWAVHDGCCGHLVVTPQDVLFRSLFAKKPRGRRGGSDTSTQLSQRVGQGPEEQPVLDARTGSLNVPEADLAASPPKIRILFECKLEHVKGIKKLSSFGKGSLQSGSSWSLAAGEGLRLILKGRRGDVDFWQVRKRDEAFNRLLALAPQQWERVY